GLVAPFLAVVLPGDCIQSQEQWRLCPEQHTKNKLRQPPERGVVCPSATPLCQVPQETGSRKGSLHERKTIARVRSTLLCRIGCGSSADRSSLARPERGLWLEKR